jgi:hypothetical protein
MATTPKTSTEPVPIMERYHVYHAGAHILSGDLEHPIKQPIEQYGKVVLEKTRRESLFTESVGETSVESLISFKAGHTRVIGSQLRNKKDIFGNDHSGWVTQSTSVLEGFNVGDVITADRVVAQVSAEHSMTYGHVPKITFLGTRFENLRVAGYPVQVELDLGICGNKPEGDQTYLQDGGFLDRVRGQLSSVVGTDDIEDKEDLPEALEKQYHAKIAYIDDLKKRAKGGSSSERDSDSKLKCSLIRSIGPIPGVKVFGNMMFIPDFGTVSLAELEVGVSAGDGGFPDNSGNGSSSEPNGGSYFTLHMLNMRLGCPLVGTTQAATATLNGQTKP